MAPRYGSLGWLSRCLLSAALVFVLCAIATARFGQRLQLPAITSRDGSLITLNRYVDEPTPDIVLVGSSLTFRLKEEYFATPRLRNLALAGGSPLTGLEIVADQPKIPKLIVVEANILSRTVDSALVARFSTSQGQHQIFFRPVRASVAAYENWMHAPLTHAQNERALQQLLEQPPSDFDNHIYLERARQQIDNEVPPAAVVSDAVETLGRLVNELEPRGARVLFLDMPCAQEIEESRFMRAMHEAVHKAFPDAGRWLSIDLDRAELRWADGVHLDERSALLVSRHLDRIFSGLQNP
jgi:hypothetical protein